MKVEKLTHWFVIFSLTVIILTGCQSDANQSNQIEPEDESLVAEEPELTEESPAELTETPVPSDTPAPTETPAPTDTPVVDINNIKFGNVRYMVVEPDILRSVTFSPDGDRVAFASSGSIKVIKTKNLSIDSILEGHSDQINGLVWTPDGNTIISVSLDGTVIFWDTENSTQSTVLQTGPVYSLDISPDGSEFVIGQESGDIQFWGVASSEMIDSIVSPTGSTVKSLSWSPDGSQVACGDDSGDIHIIDSNSHEIAHTLSLDETIANSTNTIEWSPDGKILASGHQNGQVFLWDTVNWELIKTIEWNEGWVGDVTWLPNSTVLTISGERYGATLWDINSGESILSASTLYSVYSSAWSPNGKFLFLSSAVISEDGIGYHLVIHMRIDI